MKKLLIMLFVVAFACVAWAEERGLVITIPQITIASNTAYQATATVTNTTTASGNAVYEVDRINVNVSYASGENKTCTVSVANGEVGATDTTKFNVLSDTAIVADEMFYPRVTTVDDSSGAAKSLTEGLPRFTLINENIVVKAFNCATGGTPIATETVDVIIHLIRK